MKKKLLLRESFGANLFIFASLAILIQITINLHIFDPFYRAFNDFKFTDLVYSRFHQNATDTNIVIVNIGQLDRSGIAELINKIENEDPAVIAVDALFTDLKDPRGDLALKEAVSNSKNIVLAAGLVQSKNKHADDHHPAEIQTPNTFLGNVNYGTVTLIADKGTTIRHFESFSNEGQGHIVPSFAAEIVGLYDKSAFQKLKDRNKTKEIINYKGNLGTFMHLDHPDILNSTADLNILTGKIVILGYLNEHIGLINDLEDIYFTPVNPVFSGRTNPDMKGVVIHANIISMILDESYVNESARWINWLVAFIICLLHVVLFMYYYVENHKWFHPIAKIAQLLSTVLIVWLVFIIYRYLHVEFDSKITVVSILLSVDLLYFYDGFIKFIARKFNYKSYIIEYH